MANCTADLSKVKVITREVPAWHWRHVATGMVGLLFGAVALLALIGPAVFKSSETGLALTLGLVFGLPFLLVSVIAFRASVRDIARGGVSVRIDQTGIRVGDLVQDWSSIEDISITSAGSFCNRAWVRVKPNPPARRFLLPGNPLTESEVDVLFELFDASQESELPNKE